ncbi:XRE family transcriptional regulator [Nocardioides glacieisoli]|jgi:DNA-binding phage protein|uniref:XRE family transcriptional regulator n=2 Tax=Nocardioides glacieisoli TaxID=1168730 RepID=A0A4V1RJV2_9ACTN|nr:XRE family transcriptional regulator [Nocardioides glacieisoli]
MSTQIGARGLFQLGWPHTDRMKDAVAVGETAKLLATNLRTLRAAQGETQLAVAAAAGLTPQHYRLLEKAVSPSGGPANPRLSTLLALAQVHGISVAELLIARPHA